MRYDFPEVGTVEIGAYPQTTDAEWLVHWIADMEDRDEPFEGPLPHHILRYGRYEMRDLPIEDALEQDYPRSAALASEYAAMDPATRPPCIYDPMDAALLDGNHRAQAARINGENTVRAYVGVEGTEDPCWTAWSD